MGRTRCGASPQVRAHAGRGCVGGSRFLQTDPIPGGSANAYDYAGQDPINAFDLDGRRLDPGETYVGCHLPYGGCHAPYSGTAKVPGWLSTTFHVARAIGEGVVTTAAITAICSSGIGCVILVGAGAGAVFGAGNYVMDAKHPTVTGALTHSAISAVEGGASRGAIFKVTGKYSALQAVMAYLRSRR